MTDAYLAFDIGAESGRAVLGRLDGDRLRLEELRRFPNGPVEVLGGTFWDVLGIHREILAALTACGDRGVEPCAVGVDAWGVDFGLLDAAGELLACPRAYRDRRFPAAMRTALARLPSDRLYARTGTQLLPINSVFQLVALRHEATGALERARRLLFMPDLLCYFLCGLDRSERTIASTSGLLDVDGGSWAGDVFDALGLPLALMPEVIAPGTPLGTLTAQVARAANIAPVPVVAVASHDTASAVAAVPASDADFAYISSGTWSLVGVERDAPVVTDAARRANLTNEAGVGGTVRVLRNVAGLWLLQACRRSWRAERDLTYDDLIAAAGDAPGLRSIIDPDDPSFLHPSDMPAAIAEYCRATGQRVPDGVPATTRCVLESLALAYRDAVTDLRALAGATIRRIHVVGGGARNALLNRLTAEATGLPVIAGPVEATAIGNLLVQALATGRLTAPAAIRDVVRASFAPAIVEPRSPAAWDEPYARFLQLRQHRRVGEVER